MFINEKQKQKLFAQTLTGLHGDIKYELNENSILWYS